jgi:methyl-accepting chemotaxis protein PixJ
MPSELYQAVEEARPVALAPDAELRTPSSEPQDHSALAAPITLRDVVIGALGVHVDGERRWTDDDISLVEAIAERASLAADNLRLLEETQRALGETEALYRASQAIGAAANLADIGQALVDFAAVSGVDAARVLMFEHDEQGQPVTMIWRESWTVDDRPAQPYGARLDLDDYPLAVLMDASEPLVVEDVLSDPRANQATRTLVTTVSGLRSFVMVPIAIGERWFGMLFAGRNRPGSFSEELIRGYTTLSGQAAVALESMRLLEETRRTAERERLISQVTTRVRETLDMETMLKTAAQEIRRVLDLPEVVVRLAPRRPDGDGNGAGGL